MDPSDKELRAVNVKKFYGVSTRPTNYFIANDLKKKHVINKTLPHRLNHLFGPTQVWKVFSKQKDALEFVSNKRSGLMAFAFQQSDGVRSFLVAHPQVFWHYDVQKNVSHRCSYEIIPESSVCKLYFDLEFDRDCNPDKNGPLAAHTFISIILHFLSRLFNVNASREHVLNLDSSTDKKFSRHLIFQLSSHVFSSNKSVGVFVNLVCQKLRSYFSSLEDEVGRPRPDCNKQNIVCNCCQYYAEKNIGCVADIGLSNESLKNVVVCDKKGKTRIICDEAVYTRNRHFRLFQNTKWMRNSPLLLSDDNLYCPSLQTNDKASDEIYHETLFLDSLISNIKFHDGNFRLSDLKVLHLPSPLFQRSQVGHQTCGDTFLPPSSSNSLECKPISPYPEVDKFINSVVSPGHVWRSAYFSSASVIVYDIVGNRHCQNIGRSHRSNNVKYIVNLDNYTYYQKCHDPDCSSFRSNSHNLPIELKFKLEEDSFTLCEYNESTTGVDNSDDKFDIGLSDTDLIEMATVVEDLSVVQSDEELC